MAAQMIRESNRARSKVSEPSDRDEKRGACSPVSEESRRCFLKLDGVEGRHSAEGGEIAIPMSGIIQQFQADQAVQARVKKELVAYANGNDRTRDAIAEKAICRAWQNEFAARALLEVSVGNEQETQQLQEALSREKAVTAQYARRHGPLDQAVVNEIEAAHAPIALPPSEVAKRVFEKMHKCSKIALQKMQ